jgi:hypothetical protein
MYGRNGRYRDQEKDRKEGRTFPFDFLGYFGDLSASVHGVHALDSEDFTISWDTVAVCAGVHRALESRLPIRTRSRRVVRIQY